MAAVASQTQAETNDMDAQMLVDSKDKTSKALQNKKTPLDTKERFNIVILQWECIFWSFFNRISLININLIIIVMS